MSKVLHHLIEDPLVPRSVWERVMSMSLLPRHTHRESPNEFPAEISDYPVVEGEPDTPQGGVPNLHKRNRRLRPWQTLDERKGSTATRLAMPGLYFHSSHVIAACLLLYAVRVDCVTRTVSNIPCNIQGSTPENMFSE